MSRRVAISLQECLHHCIHGLRYTHLPCNENEGVPQNTKCVTSVDILRMMSATKTSTHYSSSCSYFWRATVEVYVLLVTGMDTLFALRLVRTNVCVTELPQLHPSVITFWSTPRISSSWIAIWGLLLQTEISIGEWLEIDLPLVRACRTLFL